MRFIPVLIAATLAAAFAPTAYCDAIPLFCAAAQRQIKVEVQRSEGHARVFLGVFNCAAKEREVEFPGSYLRPKSPRYQRLALGYREDAEEGTLTIRAGESWEGWVTCCCMDRGLSSPATNTAYVVSQEPAPLLVKRIMEDWAERPWLSQSAVNERVWGVQSAPPRSPRFNFHGGRILAWEGRILVLLKTGELLRSTGDGQVEVLAEGVSATGTGFGRILARFGGDRIREYVEAAGTWVDRGRLSGVEDFIIRPRQVFAAKGCALHRLDGSGVWSVFKGGITEAVASPDPYAEKIVMLTPPNNGRPVDCIAKRDRELYILNGAAFRSAAVTESTVYGMDASGVFRITAGGRTRVIGRTGDLLAHRGGIYLIQRGWKICEYRDGDRCWRSYDIPGEVVSYSVDPVTGILYALKANGMVLSLGRGEAWTETSILA